MTGKGGEKQFETLMLMKYGKKAFVHRLTDTAEVVGLNGKGVAKKQPADYVVCAAGDMHYAEVKTTEHLTRFRRTLIREGQIEAAKRQIAAGGRYLIYVKSLFLGAWFRIPAEFIINSVQASWTWDELEGFRL